MMTGSVFYALFLFSSIFIGISAKEVDRTDTKKSTKHMIFISRRVFCDDPSRRRSERRDSQNIRKLQYNVRFGRVPRPRQEPGQIPKSQPNIRFLFFEGVGYEKVEIMSERGMKK